jgi:glycosyltransferase involved in cell wall biosynthesis
MSKKVIFCIPTIKKPHQKCLDSLAASIPLIQADGWEEGLVNEIGCPYISAARATMLRKALDAKADVIVFIDHDLSWKPEDLLTLINTEGDVVAGTYRFKREKIEYMGLLITGEDGSPIIKNSCLLGHSIPAGFLKITKNAVNRFMTAYPELNFGDKFNPSVDLFNHGAHKGVWYGEDYAFSRNWRDLGGEILIIPDLDINHHSENKDYPGNYHEYLLRQEGGSKEGQPYEVENDS